jgi:hypothetical protein
VPGGFLFAAPYLMAAFAGMTEPFWRPYFAAKTRLADLSQTSQRIDHARRRKAGGSAKDELNDENNYQGPHGRRRDGRERPHSPSSG